MPVEVWRAMVRYAWSIAASDAGLIERVLKLARGTAHSMLETYFLEPPPRRHGGREEKWLESVGEIACRKELGRACEAIKRMRKRLREAGRALRRVYEELVEFTQRQDREKTAACAGSRLQ